MKLRLSADQRSDERITAMLKRHVRNQTGSAPITLRQTTALRERLERAA